jgi:hypothetical protein
VTDVLTSGSQARRRQLVNLVVLAGLVGAIGMFLEGAAFWLGTALFCVVTSYAALAMLSDLTPRTVPLETAAMPAAAAFATMGLAHGLGPTWLAILALAAGGASLAAAVELEARLLGPVDTGDPHRRQQLVLLSVLLAFLCFSAVVASVYGDLTGPAAGTDASPGTQEANLVVMVLADAAVAFALGYRLAALRALARRDAAREAGTFAVVVGIAAALIRAIALPQLLAPALLAAVFYLWSGYRSASRAERRSNAWLWEYLALAGAAALAIAWNLLLR